MTFGLFQERLCDVSVVLVVSVVSIWHWIRSAVCQLSKPRAAEPQLSIFLESTSKNPKNFDSFLGAILTKEFSDYAILLAIGNDPIVTLAMNSNLSSDDSSTSSIPAIVLPHGGYKNLVAYKKSDVIYEGTVVFCRRFLPARGDRTVDQMVQAARSCKQNIAEGSSTSGTSKETELKLTNVARASLDELMEDYEDRLKTAGCAEWPSGDMRKAAMREFCRAHAEWADFRRLFETRPAETLANLQLCLIHQTRLLLDRLIESQENDFRKHGGVRERMFAARKATKAAAWDGGIYEYLSQSPTAEALAQREGEVQRRAADIARRLRLKKGW